MAQPSTIITAAVDEKVLAGSAQRALDTGVRNSLLGKGLDTRRTNEALRGLTDDAKKFGNELDRANRRVLSFGAAATIVYGTVRAFKELVSAGIEVEKSLTAINSIIKGSQRDLDAFGKRLFDVARETGTSFRDTAAAALEFARQGAGAAETAKRTRDAMVLVRLTGIETTKAVEGLTSMLQTFNKTGIDSTAVINKLMAADDAFAVSAGGLVEAFARVGSVVSDAGSSLDEFIGLVTAARQITGRSEAVIGNSLKTIFSRIERSDTLDNLEALGFQVRDITGVAKNAYAIFVELSKGYDNLTKEQQKYVSELAAGVFQINQFKALAGDLGKANGLAAQATNAAANATNNALIRQAVLNDTLATSIQNLKTSATQLAGVGGELTLKPTLDFLVGQAGLVPALFSNAKATGDTKAAEDFGAYIGESVLKGLGNVLLGPGLIVASKALMGTVFNVGREALRDFQQATSLFKTNLGVGNARQAEVTSLTTVNTLLNEATTAEQRRFAMAKSLAEQELVILGILEKQMGAMTEMGRASATAWSSKGTRRAAEGYVPMGEEAAAIRAGVGGAPSTARPVYLPGFNRGGGRRGIVANSSERIVNMAGGSAIYNETMIQRLGLPPGSKPVAAGGYVPNAAGGVDGPLPAWASHNLDVLFSEMERKGLVDKVVQMAAQRLTAGQIASQLGVGKESVFAVRSRFGIPPMDDTTGFNQWLQSYGSGGGGKLPPKTAMASASAPLPPSGGGRYTPGSLTMSSSTIVGAGAFQAGRTITGTQPIAPGTLNEINSIFASLSKLTNLNGAAQFTDRLLELTKGMDKLSSSTVLKDWAAVTNAIARPSPRIITGGGPSGNPANALAAQSPAGPGWRQADADVWAASTRNIRTIENAREDEEYRRDVARDNRRFRAQQELRNREAAIQRAARTEQRANRVQMATIGLSFGSAFLPEARGGTGGGMALGALGTGLQGTAMGAGAGSLFGPMGTIVGAAIGGLGGALVGFINKMNLSLEEVTKDIEEETSKLRKQAEGTEHAFELQDNLLEARARGLGGRQLAQMQMRANASLAGLPADVRDLVLGASSSPTARADASKLVAERLNRANQEGAIRIAMETASSKQRSFGSYLNLVNPFSRDASFLSYADPKAHAMGRDTLQAQYSQLSDDELMDLSKRTGQMTGFGTPDMARGAISREVAIRTTMRQLAERERKQQGAPNYISRFEAMGLASRLGVRGGIEQARIGADTEIERLLQRMEMENPGITDLKRLGLEGEFGRINIQRDIAATRASTVTSGAASIIQMLADAGVKDRSLIEGRVYALRNERDVRALQNDAKTILSKSPAETLGKLQDALSELADKLVVLNATEEEAIRSNDTTNEILIARLKDSRTVDYVRKNLRRDLERQAEDQDLANQAIIDLSGSRRSGNLISGDMLAGARFGQANRAGQKGDATGSFLGGFGSVFDGARQDLRNLAETGQQVALSLQNSFGAAFGDFVTGAKRGKDAFRDFVLSVLGDSARAFASKAVAGLLGMLIGSVAAPVGTVTVGTSTVVGSLVGAGPSFLSGATPFAGPKPGAAAGGPIGLASGGGIPAAVMKGEWIYGPAAAKRIGPAKLNAVNNGTYQRRAGGGALVTGGSGYMDDVGLRLAQGSYVVRKAMVDRYGIGTLAGLAAGGTTASINGAITDMAMPASSLVRGYAEGGTNASITAVPAPMSGGGGAVSISTNVTINDQRTSSTTSTQGNAGIADKQFGSDLTRAVNQLVMRKLEEQTRVGGMLRIQSLRGST